LGRRVKRLCTNAFLAALVSAVTVVIPSSPATAAFVLAATGPVPASASPAGPTGASVVGTSFYLNGKPWQFSGINVPQATTDYSVNGGCGASFSLLPFFDSLPQNSVVRLGFGQDATIEEGPNFRRDKVNRDWQALDRAVAAADESTTHVRLIVDLGGQSGTCDGGVFKTDEWYKSGYLRPYLGADGYARSSYWEYLREVVSRYAANRAILMWEPMGEPEASDCAPGSSGGDCYGHMSCPSDATTTLVNWFNRVGAEIRKLDPGVLVGTGELSDGQCGWAGAGELRIDEASGVDVASFHDYGSPSVAMPGQLTAGIADANEAGKPLVVGEVGIDAGDGCTISLAERAREMGAKLKAAMSAGVSGWIPWSYGTGTKSCDTYILPGDPVLAVLADAPGA
jgi:mannan endo-1,4-beta-mannosidase